MPNTLPSTKRVLTIIGLGLCLSLLGDSTLYAVLPSPTIASQAGLSMQMVGLALGLNRLVRIATNLPAGWLFDRFPRRSLMIASAGLGALSTACYALGQGTAVFLLGRVLWGLAWSGIWVGASTVVLDMANDNNRGALTGRLQMWFYLGIAFSTLAGGIFTDVFSFLGGLWLSTGLGGLGFLIWLFFLPETRRTMKPAGENQPVKDKNDSGNGFPWRLALEAAGPYFILRLVFAGILSATTILWLGSYFKEGIQFGRLALPLATLSGGFLSGRVLVSLAASPLIGTAADRVHSRWSILAACLFTGALGLWGMGRADFRLALLGALLVSISAGGIPAMTSAIIGDQVQASRHSRSLGIAFSFGDLGSAVGPTIGLELVPLIGLGSTYLVCAGIYLVGGAWALQKDLRTR